MVANEFIGLDISQDEGRKVEGERESGGPGQAVEGTWPEKERRKGKGGLVIKS